MTESSSSSSDFDYTGPPARKKFAIDPDAAAASSSSSSLSRMTTTATTTTAFPRVAGSQEPGSNNNTTVASFTHTSTTAAEISAGATKLATELNEFVRAQQVAFEGTTTTTTAATGMNTNSTNSSNSSRTLTTTNTSNNNNNNTDNNTNQFNVANLPEEAIVDLQLTTCRKLRELLPTHKELLHVAQERNWIPLILSWLNLHDRPAVQVEALLALTHIAELCAQQSYFHPTSTGPGANPVASSSTNALTPASLSSASKGSNLQIPTATTASSLSSAASSTLAAASSSLQEAMEAVQNKYAASTTAAAAAAAAAAATGNYSSLMGSTSSAAAAAAAAAASAPNSVPFPPLSFSQTLSPEAVAAFDASLTGAAAAAALQQQQQQLLQQAHDSQTAQLLASASEDKSKATNAASNWMQSAASLFPNTAGLPSTSAPAGTSTATASFGVANGGLNTASAPSAGAINFSSLAPPPSGPHSSVPGVSNNAFLPPPTPVAIPAGGGLSFPQQLSASSQHLLLRHADAIPTLISLLSSPNREVYEQAMWILGSIAAGDSPGTSTTAGASGTGGSTGSGSGTGGVGGTNSSSLDGRENKSVSARDVILAAGVMNQLLRCLETNPNNLSLQRIGSWTLSNLVDGIFQTSSSSSSSSSSSHNNKTGNNKSSSNNDYSSADEIDMKTLLPVLRRLLRMTDSEVLSYTCWTLSHLCDGPSSHIAAVVTTHEKSLPKGGLVPRLVELLTHPSWRVTKPALRTIGNIVCAECSDDTHNTTAGSSSVTAGGSSSASGSLVPSSTAVTSTTTDYTEVILECNAVPRLKELVTHSNREIQKEACWTLSNIAAGTVDQIQAVIDSGAIPPLVKLVRDKTTDQEVRSEACWVVLNATSCGSDSQIEVLVDEGCVSVLGVLLSEASMVMMALEGLERVLQVEETREMIRREQVESGEIEDDDDNRTPTLVSASLIEKARESHNSSSVTKRADRIWKQHFVSCALCRKSFSKHRTSDASFCEECKCHVCSNCNCKIYHLDYQEELWAATEEKTEAKKNAKKSKNKKKKEKLKQKKAKQQQEPETTSTTGTGNGNSVSSSNKESGNNTVGGALASASTHSVKTSKTAGQSTMTTGSTKDEMDQKSAGNGGSTGGPMTSGNGKDEDNIFEDEDGDEDDSQNQIDFVLYLQQTGSIIALAKLMDALEYGGDDYDEELDDYERKMIREQQLMRGQTTASHHQTAAAHSAH